MKKIAYYLGVLILLLALGACSDKSSNPVNPGDPGMDNPDDPGDSPTETTQEITLNGDGGFGFDVQIDGNRAIVGAPGNDDKGADAGAAYIYELQDGEWTQTAKLTASDGAAGDLFGHTVAIDGNRVLVSAHGRDKPAVNAGAAYVFDLQGGTWVETQILTATDAANPSNFDFARMGDQFGRGLAMDGNTIVVGAANRDASGFTSGEAYIFELQGDTWVETQQILPSDISEAFIDPPGGDNFGRGVAISGNTIVAGSPADDDKGPQSGSAYIFEKQNGMWVEAQKLTASDGETGDGFGFSLSIDGDRLVVGVGNDDDGGDASGSVYVFERQGGTWTETDKLTASDADAGDFFGFDAAVQGDVIVVGAEFDEAAEASIPGSCYIFKFSNGTWSETDKISPKEGQGDLNYGASIALSDAYIFVGASATFPQIPNSTAGKVYLFDLNQ